LARLSEMVARRLREHDLHARTVQLKLRYSDFTTITRAHSFDHGTQLDTEIFQQVRGLFRANRKANATIRLLGVHASGLKPAEGQLNMLEEPNTNRWRKAMTAVDKMRDKFGEDSVSLAMGLKGRFRERVHENPAGLPGKTPGKTPRKDST
jgi:DNA polymerase IV